MKTIKVSDEDYERLEWLGTDKWMVCKGEKPLSVEKVLHSCIASEWNRANPPRYRSLVGRED